MQRYRIGLDNNPIFADVYRRPATAAAASLMAADALFESRVKTAFNPSGGTHHGMPDKANGFCFVNDPALAILRLLLKGAQKVAYVDIDAHHPDGVQAHLSGDERVQLWSIHEKNRWPRTGQSGDNGEGFARNFTLERGLAMMSCCAAWTSISSLRSRVLHLNILCCKLAVTAWKMIPSPGWFFQIMAIGRLQRRF